MPNDAQNSPQPTVIGQNLRALIDKAQKSVNAWANEHGLTQTTVNRIIRGQLDPTIGMVERISQVTGIPVIDLLQPNLGASRVPEVRLTSTERDLILAFRDIPEATQREVLQAVMAQAEQSRQHVDKILRERFGVTGYVSPDKAAAHLPGPPPSPDWTRSDWGALDPIKPAPRALKLGPDAPAPGPKARKPGNR
ncbi:helix-turn-helix domain-containing protein [Eleftheria terrae]|uniref:helix-turn-helix domain-containing protein n=1 Tax=Eleftheria terrae TaxID=1597781 RepID=UPI00263A6A2A|nr:helix-turn-helix transcriptional regulator [Eleftheria terrae]WKB52995.1 helix-turn-helix domain-containing protein [Eleftheria terrae]